MAERNTIETYGRAPHNRNIWSTATERHTIETYGRHAWPILLFALVSPFYTLLPLISQLRSLLGLAPLYLRELCCPLHSAMSLRSLRSSQQGLLLVPFARTSAKQSLPFPWWVPRSGMGSLLNFGFSLEPCHLRFFSQLKTALFSCAGVGSASD